jgi:4-amino-4-deoxy-L-arabinose transferase-like glycosyltransferase
VVKQLIYTRPGKLMTTQTSERYTKTALKFILALTVLQLAVTLFTNGFVLSFDEAMWHYIGRNWFRNHLIPYQGGVDNKSPLIFAIFGLSDTLFGVNYWFPRVVGTLCSAVGVFYIYKIAKHIAGERAGILAMSFYGLSLLWNTTGGRYVSFTETYDITFIILAFYTYLTQKKSRNFYISGLLAGIGVGFRLSGIFGVLTLLIVIARKSLKNALIFLAGVISSLFILGLGCFIAGINLQSILVNGLSDNFGSGSTTDHSFLWKLESFTSKFFYSELLLFYPFLLGYIFTKKKIDLYILWLILEMIGLGIIGTFGALHLKEVLPPLSLISAFFVNHIINTYNVSFKQLLIVVWILFFPKLLEPLTNLKKILTGNADSPEISDNKPFTIPDEATRKKLGIWIKTHTNYQQKVFVAGYGAQVQVYSERISPTIYFNVTQTRLAKQVLFDDLKRNKPDMILVPLFPEYQDLVSADMRKYVDELIVDSYELQSTKYGYSVYLLKKEKGGSVN